MVFIFVFRMFMMRMSDVPYLNISGTDCKNFVHSKTHSSRIEKKLMKAICIAVTPSRDHVFYVTCPPTATAKDVEGIFKVYGIFFKF